MPATQKCLIAGPDPMPATAYTLVLLYYEGIREVLRVESLGVDGDAISMEWRQVAAWLKPIVEPILQELYTQDLHQWHASSSLNE
jgi:hypothetical protein